MEPTTLEGKLKRNDCTKDITVKLNFLKKRLGENNLVMMLRQLDESNHKITEIEMDDKMAQIIGKESLSNIKKTLKDVLTMHDYQFKK